MKRFEKNKKRNTMIIIAVVIVVGLVVSINLIKSHAHFKTSKNFNVIQGKIPNKNNGDILLAVKVDDKKQDAFPEKGDYIVWSDCTNDMSVEWDYDNWKAKINSDITNPFACNINFKSYDKFINTITYNEEVVDTYPEKGNLNVSVSCNNIGGSWDYDNWKPILTGANNDTVCNIKFEDKKELLVTKEILDQGEFKNVTPEYITDGVNGTDGFTITGYASNRQDSVSGCTWGEIHKQLRWDYELNFDNYNYVKFYARINSGVGVAGITISDGLKNASNCPSNPTTIYLVKSNVASSCSACIGIYMSDQWLRGYEYGVWNEIVLDVSDIKGTHTISFIGGYVDISGQYADTSSTSFSNIRFTNS